MSYEAVDEAIWKLRPQRPTSEVVRPEIGLSGTEMSTPPAEFVAVEATSSGPSRVGRINVR